MKALRATYRMIALATVVWALGVTSYFLFFAKISYESVTVSASQGEPPVTTHHSGQAPWVTEAGLVSVAAMLTFSLLLGVGAAAASRGLLAVAAPLSLLTLAGSYVTGFSIGGYYLPGAAGLFLCTALVVIEKLSRRLNRPARLTTRWSRPGQPDLWLWRDTSLGWPGGSSRGR